MEVTDRNGGGKGPCDELVIPRILCEVMACGTSSDDEFQEGPLWFTGLLANGL
jgi:hypothetical protein